MCFGAFLPARHVGRGFLRKRRMKFAVKDLLAKKVQMSESDRAPKDESVNQYIKEKLAYYKALLERMKDDRNPDWEPLERIFRSVI